MRWEQQHLNLHWISEKQNVKHFQNCHISKINQLILCIKIFSSKEKVILRILDSFDARHTKKQTCLVHLAWSFLNQTIFQKSEHCFSPSGHRWWQISSIVCVIPTSLGSSPAGPGNFLFRLLLEEDKLERLELAGVSTEGVRSDGSVVTEGVLIDLSVGTDGVRTSEGVWTDVSDVSDGVRIVEPGVWSDGVGVWMGVFADGVLMGGSCLFETGTGVFTDGALKGGECLLELGAGVLTELWDCGVSILVEGLSIFLAGLRSTGVVTDDVEGCGVNGVSREGGVSPLIEGVLIWEVEVSIDLPESGVATVELCTILLSISEPVCGGPWLCILVPGLFWTWSAPMLLFFSWTLLVTLELSLLLWSSFGIFWLYSVLLSLFASLVKSCFCIFWLFLVLFKNPGFHAGEVVKLKSNSESKLSSLTLNKLTWLEATGLEDIVGLEGIPEWVWRLTWLEIVGLEDIPGFESIDDVIGWACILETAGLDWSCVAGGLACWAWGVDWFWLLAVSVCCGWVLVVFVVCSGRRFVVLPWVAVGGWP